MKFPAINSLLTDQLLKALCNTLVHSLWQGIILAAVAGLIIIGTKKASSALRYNLLIAALVLFATGTVVTFVTQFHLPVYSAPNQQANIVNQSPIVIQPFRGHAAVQAGSVVDVVSGYLNTYHNSIVLIWFLIICAKSIQLGVGLYGTYQLKRVNVISVKGFWSERMKQLACLLGIKQGITMLESGLAKVPMVIGHLKPVILIPIGLLTALSAEEVEAILVHELAHIKRRDYLVNMLQSLMEIVFFFNPAVLWISQLIKTERENCCDDMALEQSTNKVNYIRALVSCEEYQAAVPAYAMAFPGSKGTLLDRVKRLASNRNHSLNLFEKTLLAVCLVVSGLCVSAFAEKDNIKHTVHEMVKAFQHTLINKEQQNKLAEQNALLGKQTAMIRENTGLLQLKSAGLEIENDTTKKVHQVNVNINPMNLQLQNVNVQTAPLNVQVSNNVNVQSNVKVNLDPLNLSLGHLSGPLGKVDTNDKAISLYKKKFHEIGRELFKMHVLTDTSNMSINLNERLLIVNGVEQPEETHRLIYAKFGGKGNLNGYEGANSNGNYNSYPNGYSPSNSASYSNGYSNSYSSGYGLSTNSTSTAYSNSSAYHANPSPKYNSDTNRRLPRFSKPPIIPRTTLIPRAPLMPRPPVVGTSPDIGDELLKAHLITDKNNFKVELNNKELIVNGVKQSEDNHQLILKKYMKKAGDKVNINFSYSNTTNKGASVPDLLHKLNERGDKQTGNDTRLAASQKINGVFAQVKARQIEVADELLKENIITNTKNLNFSLTNEELIVNGVKQPEEIHHKIISKYVKEPGDILKLSYGNPTK